MIIIPIRRGRFVLVDEDEAPRASQHLWSYKLGRPPHRFATPRDGTGYALRKSLGYMHRWLLGVPADNPLVIDHLNGWGLDNRKLNLRVVTNSINGRNRRLH